MSKPTVALVDLIRAEIRAVDFWSKPPARERPRPRVVIVLEEPALLPIAPPPAAADPRVALAKHHHAALL